MDAIEAILARRSDRSEEPSEPVSDEHLELILRCGAAAPSSKNAQPWRLHPTRAPYPAELAGAMLDADGIEQFVPLDPATGRKREEWPSTVAESAAILRSADVAIFIENAGAFSRSRSVVASVPRDLLEDALIGFSLEMIGLGAAVENMWIAATALGLSVAFIGDVLVAEEVVQQRLGLGGDLVGVLTLRSLTSPAGEESASPSPGPAGQR